MTEKERVRRFFDFSFPELGSNLDDEFDFFYEQFSKQLPQKYWLQTWTEGMAYRIAHAIAMRNIAKKGNGTGAVPQVATSKSVGKLSIGYGSGVSDAKYADAGEFATTIYGRHFWDIMQLLKPTGMVV